VPPIDDSKAAPDPRDYCKQKLSQSGPQPKDVADLEAFANRQPTAPSITHAEVPVHPQDAGEAGKDADVTVRILIDKTGAPRRVLIVVPGGPGFDRAAMEAGCRFRFWPACSRDGTPTNSLIEYRFQFRLARSTAAPAGGD